MKKLFKRRKEKRQINEDRKLAQDLFLKEQQEQSDRYYARSLQHQEKQDAGESKNTNQPKGEHLEIAGSTKVKKKKTNRGETIESNLYFIPDSYQPKPQVENNTPPLTYHLPVTVPTARANDNQLQHLNEQRQREEMLAKVWNKEDLEIYEAYKEKACISLFLNLKLCASLGSSIKQIQDELTESAESDKEIILGFQQQIRLLQEDPRVRNDPQHVAEAEALVRRLQEFVENPERSYTLQEKKRKEMISRLEDERVQSVETINKIIDGLIETGVLDVWYKALPERLAAFYSNPNNSNEARYMEEEYNKISQYFLQQLEGSGRKQRNQSESRATNKSSGSSLLNN